MSDSLAAREVFNQGGLNPGLDYAPGPLTASMLQAAAASPLPQSQDTELSDIRIPLAEARWIIIAAFTSYDPALGRRAEALLASAVYKGGEADLALEAHYRAQPHDHTGPAGDNPYLRPDYQIDVTPGARWDISPVAPGQGRLMRCLPAGAARTAYDPPNPYGQAVIEFEYDGTINSVIYMAHEAGHALADDTLRQAGHDYRRNPSHLPEIQAYMLQNVMYDYLINRQDDPALAAAAQAHFAATMTDAVIRLPEETEMEARPMSLLVARGFYDHVAAQPLLMRRAALTDLLGGNGPKNITEVLAASGIITPADMERLAQSAVAGLRDRGAGSGAQPGFMAQAGL